MAFHTMRRRILNLSISSSSSISTPKLESQFPWFQFQLVHPFSTRKSKSSPEITQYLMNSHQLSLEASLNAASVLSHINNYKQTSTLILDYLKQTGFSNSQLNKLIESHPRFLTLNLSKTIQPRIQTIQDLGFAPDDLAELLTSVPAIFTVQRGNPRITSSVLVLQRLLGSNSEVIKLLRVCDWFLASDLEKTLMPNIEFLESCGVTPSQIRRLLFNFPRFFLNKTDYLRDCVRRVDEMGLSRHSKMYIHGIRAVGSMSPENWDSKVELLRSLGFSQHDVLTVFRRTPQIFAISENKIKEVTNLLLISGGVDISFVVQHPELLIYSATRRIKPRLQIFNILQSKSLIPKVPPLTSLCKVDDNYFIRKFVLPYVSQLGEVGENYLASRDLMVCNASA